MAANSIAQDIALIAKKIGVGIVIMLVPLIILVTGLWLVQTLL